MEPSQKPYPEHVFVARMKKLFKTKTNLGSRIWMNLPGQTGEGFLLKITSKKVMDLESVLEDVQCLSLLPEDAPTNVHFVRIL